MNAARQPAWLPAAALAGSVAFGLLASTWRLQRTDAPEYTRAAASGERFVYAFWHSGIVTATWWRRHEGIAVLVSQHHDGELITRLIERLGYVTARGSSTRGGAAGFREMIAWAEAGHDLALTPDGPRGPAERLKDGLLQLAAHLGRRVVPLAAVADRAWRARAWDAHRIPQPFARVCMCHAAPIAIPQALEGEALARARSEVGSALAAVTAAMRRAAGVAT